jgi:DNA polymerase III delta prime subunit
MELQQLNNYSLGTVKIKSIRFIGKEKAHNLSCKKNKNFILSNGIVTHNTSEAYDSLKALMEKALRSYGRFIGTCNTPSRIPGPILSRFDDYYFKQLPKEYVLSFFKTILENEKVKYKEDDIKFIINTFYPDIRKALNRLERCVDSNVLIMDKEKILTIEKKIIGLFFELIDAKLNSEKSKIDRLIEQLLVDIRNPEISYTDIYTNLFYDKRLDANVKIAINKYANKHNDCLEVSINFMAMVYESLSNIQMYQSMVGKK